MSIDGYIWVKPGGAHKIEGETLDSYVLTEKGFDIETFSWGVTNPVNVGSGSSGLGSGRAEFEKMTFTKKTDTATCAIILSACAGTHHPKMHLILRKGGATSDTSGGEFLHVTFTDVVFESITWEGSDGDEAFSDNVTVAYAELKFEYSEQDMTGKLKKGKGRHGEMGWNQTKNKVAA